MVGSHPFPTAPKVDIKTFPSPPPTTKRTDDYIEERVFENFPKLLGTKVQNVRTGVLGFLTSGKGVNIWNDNLRVHTADSDIRATSIETIVHSKWLEWHSHGCPKVTGTTSKF